MKYNNSKKQSTKKGRITSTFDRLKEEGKKGLITFITAGDPNLRTSKSIILELERSGADIIELGIPFSDPMADGVAIQESSERALKKGVLLKDVLNLTAEVRKKSEVPIVLFGYYNPVFHYGLKRFAKEAARAGADGVLIVDLPPEEAEELTVELDSVGLDHIFLLTPTSDESRIKVVNKHSSGFVYYVSVTGVTGARKKLSGDLKRAVKNVASKVKLPLCVGFGVSTPEQAREVSTYCDGVVVGSALVNIIKKGASSKGGAKGTPKKAGAFAGKLKRALAKG